MHTGGDHVSPSRIIRMDRPRVNPMVWRLTESVPHVMLAETSAALAVDVGSLLLLSEVNANSQRWTQTYRSQCKYVDCHEYQADTRNFTMKLTQIEQVPSTCMLW